MRKSYIIVPNSLICDSSLLPSAKRVAVALLAYRNQQNACCKSVATLVKRSGVSRGTVLRAHDALEEHGFLRRQKRYRYDALLHRPVFAANRYSLHIDLSMGYTLVPRWLLHSAVSHATFVISLFLYQCAGRTGRAYPSLRYTARTLDCSKSTVCRAVSILILSQEIIRLRCRNCLGCYSCNSYYVVFPVAGIASQPLTEGYHIGSKFTSPAGGPKFDTVPLLKR